MTGPPLPRHHTPSWKLLSQGAEARIWLIPSYLSTPASHLSAICKERYPRKYRHPDLDASILKSRTRAEVRCLARCRRGGVPCPAVFGVDIDKKGGGSSFLFMEFVDGITAREFFESRRRNRARDDDDDDAGEGGSGSDGKNDDESKSNDATTGDNGESPPRKKTKTGDDNNNGGDGDDAPATMVASQIGRLVAKMHNTNIIHGDLTTSNILLRNKFCDTTSSSDGSPWVPDLCLIDFGLSGTAGAKGVSHEEKAVDLYVLERAFEATHPNSQGLVKEMIKAYKAACTTGDSVLQRLAQVRLRGRKRDCFG